MSDPDRTETFDDELLCTLDRVFCRAGRDANRTCLCHRGNGRALDQVDHVT